MEPLLTATVGFARDERGGVLPLFGLCLTVILGFAALAIDLTHQNALRAQLTATADAAALAAARQLPNQNKAREKALEYAEANMPKAQHGTVLDEDDIVFGTWFVGRHQFIAGGPIANTVRVTVRRSKRNGNPAPTFFMHIFGRDHADLSAEALAGIVLFDNVPRAGAEASEADLDKLAQMQEALEEEAKRRQDAAGRDAIEAITEEEAAELLMEEFGRAVLLK
jgi:hypothetical protein